MDRTFKPALILMSGRAAGLAATFVIPIVLVRILDQAQFGLYKQFFLIHVTLFGIAQVGLAESLFYFLPQAGPRAGRYVFNATLALAAAGVVCLALLAGGASMLHVRTIGSALPSFLPSLGIYLLLSLSAATLEIAMISRGRYLLASAAYGLSDIARAVACVLPVLLRPSLESLFASLLVFASIRFVATLWYMKAEFSTNLRADPKLLRAQFAYSLPFAAAVLVETLQANLHHYAVMLSFDAATFALYAAGCLQIPLVDLVGSSAANVMMVRMGEARSRGSARELLDLWHDTTRKLALFFVPAAALLMISAHEVVVVLFTDAYTASTPILRLWSLTLLCSVLQVDAVLRVFARTRDILILNTVRLALVVALIGPLIASFHLQGAVLVSLIATFAGKALGLVRIRALTSTATSTLLPWPDLARICMAATGASVAALILRQSLPAPPLASLLVTAIGFAFTYFTLLVSLGAAGAPRLPAGGEAVSGTAPRPACPPGTQSL